MFPELGNVNEGVEADCKPGAVEVLDGAATDIPAASLEGATAVKVGVDVAGELEKLAILDDTGEIKSSDDALLLASGATDLTSAFVPPIPNDKVLAALFSAVVPSDLADVTNDNPTGALEEKLNPVNAGDDEIAGLLLDTANMEVETAELIAGLSVGGGVVSFGGEYDKPLLRLEVDATDVKWRGAFSVVDAAEGNTLSDGLATSSAFSVLSPLSELVLANVVGLVTLWPSVDLFFAVDVSKSDVIGCLMPKMKFEAPVCLSLLTEASGIADTPVAGRVPGGPFENANSVLLSTEALGTAFPGSFDKNKPPDEVTVLDSDATGCSLIGEPAMFFKFGSTLCSNIFCSTFCSFLFESIFCSVVSTSILLDGIRTSRSSSNSGKSSITAILKAGVHDLEAETEFPKRAGLSEKAAFGDPSFIIFSLSFFSREPFKFVSRGPFAPSKS